MGFRDKTAYVWGLGYRWYPLLSWIVNPRTKHNKQPWYWKKEISRNIIPIKINISSVEWSPSKSPSTFALCDNDYPGELLPSLQADVHEEQGGLLHNLHWLQVLLDGDFPRKGFRDPLSPPQKSTKLFYTELSLPTFEEGTSNFVFGGPYQYF